MPEQTSRKKILFVGIIFILLGIIVGYILINRSQQIERTGTFTVRNLFPFSDQTITPQPIDSPGDPFDSSQIGPDQSQVISFAESARLRRITNYPVTGYTSFVTKRTIQEPKINESTGETFFVPQIIERLVLRFNSKINGIIGDAEITTDTVIVEQKTTTEVPVVEEIWFADKGKYVFFRTWNIFNREIDTLVGEVSSEQTEDPSTLNNLTFLVSDILRGTVNPDGSSIFFLRKTAQDNLQGIVRSAVTGEQKTIFSSPFTEWKPVWINNETITLTTLASRESSGYMYTLNPITGVLRKLLGPIRGVTTLTNPINSLTFYSTSTDQGFQSFIFNHVTGNQISLDLSTLAEKCVWENDAQIICAVPNTIPQGKYPDQWYQDSIGFSDTFWRITTTNQSTERLFSPDEITDGISLGLSADKKYLFYINKEDGTLWSYRLNE